MDRSSFHFNSLQWMASCENPMAFNYQYTTLVLFTSHMYVQYRSAQNLQNIRTYACFHSYKKGIDMIACDSYTHMCTHRLRWNNTPNSATYADHMRCMHVVHVTATVHTHAHSHADWGETAHPIVPHTYIRTYVCIYITYAICMYVIHVHTLCSPPPSPPFDRCSHYLWLVSHWASSPNSWLNKVKLWTT